MTPEHEHLQSRLQRLQLHRVAEILDTVAQDAAKEQLSYTEFLTRLLEAGAGARVERSTATRIRLAHFPFYKTLGDFDFSFQPSLDPKKVKELAKLRFIEQGENIVLLGPPGVGKTHLAVALSIKATEAGYRVLFTTATDVVGALAKALAEHRFEERLKLLPQPKLLSIDEMDSLPLDKRDATCFFQLVSRRYERDSIILTSDKSYGDWGSIFAGDPVMAAAILDRLLPHSLSVSVGAFSVVDNRYV